MPLREHCQLQHPWVSSADTESSTKADCALDNLEKQQRSVCVCVKSKGLTHVHGTCSQEKEAASPVLLSGIAHQVFLLQLVEGVSALKIMSVYALCVPGETPQH